MATEQKIAPARLRGAKDPACPGWVSLFAAAAKPDGPPAREGQPDTAAGPPERPAQAGERRAVAR